MSKLPSIPPPPPPATSNARVTRVVALRSQGSGPHVTRSRAASRVLHERYELRRRIGAGGMAEVFLATDLMLERDVAVKILHARLATDAGQVDRFRREALTLAGLDSPRIIAVHDLHLGPDEHYLVMQYVIGRTFEQLIDECGALAPERAARIVGDVLEGLAALHMRGLIHRDVKPSNVLVDWDDRAVLADLGIACDRRRPSLTPAHTTLGTPDFMAPEQRATGAVDQRSDVYQAGALLFLAMTGRDASQLAAGERTEALAGTPHPYARVIARALDAEPSTRWPSADAMRTALIRAAEDRSDVIEVETLQIVEIGDADPPGPAVEVAPLDREPTTEIVTAPVIELRRRVVQRPRARTPRLAIAAAAAVALIAAFLWMARGEPTERATAEASVEVAMASPPAPTPEPSPPPAAAVLAGSPPAPPPQPLASEIPAAPRARRAPARPAPIAHEAPELLKHPDEYLYLADLYESSGAADSAVRALRLYQRVAPTGERAAAEQRIQRLTRP
jgi:serine/threonine-protein kinase